MRVVFDTNVWIDWLYFNDIAVDPLKLLRKDKYLEILIDEQCLAELVIVLKRMIWGGLEFLNKVIFLKLILVHVK